MTNKRQLKKYISRIAAEVSELTLAYSLLTGEITEEQVDETLTQLSALHTDALSKLSIAYDKTPEAFESMRAYSAAKRAYFKQAYAKALSEYEAGVQKLLEPLNKAK